MIIDLIERLRDVQEQIDELARQRRDLNRQLDTAFKNARTLHQSLVAEQRSLMSRELSPSGK